MNRQKLGTIKTSNNTNTQKNVSHDFISSDKDEILVRTCGWSGSHPLLLLRSLPPSMRCLDPRNPRLLFSYWTQPTLPAPQVAAQMVSFWQNWLSTFCPREARARCWAWIRKSIENQSISGRAAWRCEAESTETIQYFQRPIGRFAFVNALSQAMTTQVQIAMHLSRRICCQIFACDAELTKWVLSSCAYHILNLFFRSLSIISDHSSQQKLVVKSRLHHLKKTAWLVSLVKTNYTIKLFSQLDKIKLITTLHQIRSLYNMNEQSSEQVGQRSKLVSTRVRIYQNYRCYYSESSTFD